MLEPYELGMSHFIQNKNEDACEPLMKLINNQLNKNYTRSKFSEDPIALEIWRDNYKKVDQGIRKAKIDYLKSYVTQFMQEYNELAKKHNADIHIGCGCCSGGYYITVNGVNYEFDPEDYK